MNVTERAKVNAARHGWWQPSGGLVGKWVALCLAVACVWLFMFVIGPYVKRFPAVNTLTRFIEETGIDARALYYTEIDETSEAEMHLRDSEKYAPGSNQ